MRWNSAILTYVTVTVMTLLIWLWAAGETRDSRTIDAVNVAFTTTQPRRWIVAPDSIRAAVRVDGTPVALQRAQSLLHLGVTVEVPEIAGDLPINLLDALRQDKALDRSGARVLSVEPPVMHLMLDVMQTYTARVQPILRGLEAAGEITIDPPTVNVTMPSSLRDTLPDDLVVQGFLEHDDVSGLEPGASLMRNIVLRLPADQLDDEGIIISPSTATVSFTLAAP